MFVWCVSLVSLIVFYDILESTASALYQLQSTEYVSQYRIAPFGDYLHRVKVLHK